MLKIFRGKTRSPKTTKSTKEQLNELAQQHPRYKELVQELDSALNELGLATKKSSDIIGCSCDVTKLTSKEWDEAWGGYYHFYECPKCGYYWEGYM